MEGTQQRKSHGKSFFSKVRFLISFWQRLSLFAGYLIGFSVALAHGTGSASETIALLFDVWILAITLVAAPGMSLLANCVPALIAACKYPADILREGQQQMQAKKYRYVADNNR